MTPNNDPAEIPIQDQHETLDPQAITRYARAHRINRTEAEQELRDRSKRIKIGTAGRPNKGPRRRK